MKEVLIDGSFECATQGIGYGDGPVSGRVVEGLTPALVDWCHEGRRPERRHMGVVEEGLKM